MNARSWLFLVLWLFGCVSNGWSATLPNILTEGIPGSVAHFVQPTTTIAQSPPAVTQLPTTVQPVITAKTVACLAGTACCAKGCQECGKGCGKLCCGLWDCTKGAVACTIGFCICCAPVCESLGHCLFRAARSVTRGCLGAICKPTSPDAPGEWPVLSMLSKGSVNLESLRPFFYGSTQHYLWHYLGEGGFRNTLSFSNKKGNKLSKISSDQWPALIAGVENIVLTFPLVPKPLINLMPKSTDEPITSAHGYTFHLRGTVTSKKLYQFADVMKAWSKEGKALCVGLDIAVSSPETNVLSWLEYFMEQPAVQLRHLSVRFLSLTDTDLQSLYKALVPNSRFLEVLDLSLNALTGASMSTSTRWCCKENPGGIISFVEDIENFPQLQSIKLLGNPLGNKTSDKIFSALAKRQGVNNNFRIQIGFNGAEIPSWVKEPMVEFPHASVPAPASTPITSAPVSASASEGKYAAEDSHTAVLAAAPPLPTITPYFSALSYEVFGELYQNIGQILWDGLYDPIFEEDPFLSVFAKWPEALQLIVSARPNLHTLILDGTQLNMFFLASILSHLNPKQLTKLSLKGTFGGTGESLTPVLQSMKRFTGLTSLELGNNFPDGTFPPDLFKTWPHLTYLGLSGNNLGKVDVRDLLKTIQSLPSLLMLDLSRNELTDEHLPFIYPMVSSLPSLTLLDLSSNQFSLRSYGDWFMPLLDEFNSFPSAQKTNPISLPPSKSRKSVSSSSAPPLSASAISLPGSVSEDPRGTGLTSPHLDEELPAAPTDRGGAAKELESRRYAGPQSLEIIKLANNPLDEETVAAIQAFYGQNPRAPLPLLTYSDSDVTIIGNRIRYSNVSHLIGNDPRLPFSLLSTLPVLELRNTAFSNQGMIILERMFSRNTLIILDMSKNILGPSSKKSLNTILLGNPGLRELHLSHMNMGPALVEGLTGLGSLHKLAILDLGYNNLEEKGLTLLAPFIQKFSGLTKLSLQANQFGKGMPCLMAGFKLLNTALSHGPTGLHHINLSNNNIGPNDIRSLVPGLARQRDLEILKIGFNPLLIDGSRSLAGLVTVWPSLKELHARDIKMGDGAKALVTSLTTRRDLHFVDFQDHGLTHEEAEILKPLEYIPNLIFLPAQ